MKYGLLTRKKIIRCPKCEENGRSQNIGELLEKDYIGIQRVNRKKYGKDYTIIQGTDFKLICGHCGETVFVRKPKEEII